MAHTQTTDLSTGFDELSSSAQLDILVPTSADFDPTSLFHDGLPGRLSSAPSRRNLYFGTRISSPWIPYPSDLLMLQTAR